MMPLCSCTVPGRKPGTSSKVIRGILKQSQKRIKTGSLVAGVNVKDTGQPGGLIGNNTYGTTSQATKPHTTF